MASLTVIQDFERRQMDAITAKRRVPEFAPGDTVKVMVKVIEGLEDARDKKKGAKPKVEDKGPGYRLQAYEGVVIARSGAGLNESFTVRKISYGEGVERVFPIYSPYIVEIEVLRRGKVRRAKLYYLRDRRGKSARISENTGVRARKLNDAERDALNAERARLEAEKVAAAEALAVEKAAEDEAQKKAPAA